MQKLGKGTVTVFESINGRFIVHYVPTRIEEDTHVVLCNVVLTPRLENVVKLNVVKHASKYFCRKFVVHII